MYDQVCSKFDIYRLHTKDVYFPLSLSLSTKGKDICM